MIMRKSCSNHHFAHLYEHIFCIQVDTLLREAGKFPIVDYDMVAYTENGVVYFELIPYSEIDVDTVLNAASTSLSASRHFFDIAVHQIEAEYGNEIIFEDKAMLIRDINAFNKLDWNSPPKFFVAEDSVSTGGRVDVKTIEVTVPYSDRLPKDIMPLTRLVNGITLNVLVSDLADTLGGFVSSQAFATNDTKQLSSQVRLSTRSSNTYIQQLFEQTVKDLQSDGAYDRLAAMLRDIDTMNQPPSPEATLKDTGTSMTSAMWRDVANKDNLQKIINRMSVNVSVIE